MPDSYSERQEKLFFALKQNRISDARSILQSSNTKENSFVTYIDGYFAEHGFKRQFILQKAGIDMSYGYKLLSGAKHTNNRNRILRLLLALGMSEEEMQMALSLYGMKPLNKGEKRDSVILLGPAYNVSIDEIDRWLNDLDYEPIFDD